METIILPEVVEKFLKYDYAETRDLLKAFITLISATLVFSLTFSDKIATMTTTEHNIRLFVFGAWASFFAALALAGGGIVSMAVAAGCVLYGSMPIFTCGVSTFSILSWVAGLAAGLLYTLGLLLLIMAAYRSYLPLAPTPTSSIPAE